MTPISIVKKLYSMSLLWREVPEDTKYVWPWFHSILPGHYPLRDEHPWITFKAISWLKDYLNPEMRVFEYGSGGSTLFMSRRVKEVYSVEHERKYFNLVDQILKDKGVNNCHYQLKTPSKLESLSTDYYIHSCTSLMEKWQGLDFSDYVGTIDEHPDGFFDLVVVDGRSRISCIAKSLKKIKQGGWIMLDNSERQQYESGRKLLSNYQHHDFYGLVPSNLPLYQTSVWHLNDHYESRVKPIDTDGSINVI